MKRISLAASILTWILCQPLVAQSEGTRNQLKSFTPGTLWKDNNGVHINAHGGGVLYEKGTYYWFGEHKTEGRGGNVAQVGVHCYSSTDLYNWTDRGIALSVSNDPTSDIVKGCILERPKVIYNKKTGKYVMWFHLEPKGKGYGGALVGIAQADKVTGPYTLRAGIVKHLTTDFNFNLAPELTIGKLINTLHPTPAVCGIPKNRTYKYILSNEEYDRKYYSGFTGVVNCDEGTHLYVTLRCMQIEGPEYKLYGGGGLLADSEEHNEWLETETKMETIRKCLAIKRM